MWGGGEQVFLLKKARQLTLMVETSELAKRFEVKKSVILTTQVQLLHNTITGCYKAVKVYDQKIQWGGNVTQRLPFSLSSATFSCTCRFFTKSTSERLKCCKHIIGHLRRIIHNSK